MPALLAIVAVFLQSTQLLGRALPTETLSYEMPMPTCSYTIRRDQLDGPILRYARVGDQVVHRWECESDMYGVLVHSCFVEDGQGEKAMIVDERGSEHSFPSRASEFDNQKHFMPRRDRLLIVKSWRKTQKTGAEHVGSKIFLRVLTTQPDIKAIFGLEKIPQGRLKYDPRFRQHALVYTKTFDYVVKNLEFPEKLEHHFDSLGRRHVQYQGRGFDPSFWETFAECMTQTAAEWDQHRHRPTTCAWRSLVSTIIMFMRRGFDDEVGRKKSTSIIRTGALPNSRKSSAYLGAAAPAQCPYSSSPQPTYNAHQAQELYNAYAYGDQRKYSGCPMDQQRRSKSQTPY